MFDRPMNIVEVDVMLNALIDFFNNNDTHITVGGICGSPLLRTVLDATTAYTSFDKVLIADGCPDIVYMKKPEHAMVNHIYYRNLMVDKTDSDVFTFDPFSLKRPTVNRPALRYLNDAYLKMYDVIVLHNAHLMDHIFRDAILQYFHGKVVVVVDPFDIHGEVFVDTPTIIRSFHKLPTIIGAARHMWGVETDMLNKSAKGGVYHGKIRRNSIGALGNQMYVTNDTVLIDIIRSKQTMNPIRKNQKFVITDKRIMMGLDDNNLSHHLSEGDIVIAGQQNDANTRQPFRIFKSNTWVYLTLKRDVTETNVFAINGCDVHQIRAMPANIIDVDTAALHRFNHTIFVQTDAFILTNRMMYSLMKNSVTLTVCKIKQ